MAEFSVAQARDHLPKLVAQAEAGEVVTITKRGKPVAELRGNAAPAAASDEQRDAIYEELRKLREAGPKLDISSVELLGLVYEDYAY